MQAQNNTTAKLPPLEYNYDYYIVAFSGGKDSLACLLHLLDCGVPRSQIELWHQDIDGREGSSLMDWKVTRDYCKKVSEALGIKLYYSWRKGGFEAEMLRNETATAESVYETPDGTRSSGGEGKPGVRRKFPQKSADLSVRWCSSALKIDVCSAAIRNQERFVNRRTLFVSGERAEESASRSNYLIFEPHRTDNRGGAKVDRLVDHWRPVHSWSEKDVWSIIERYKINPHPAYKLGWGRVSCAACIFGSCNQWASLNMIAPDQVMRIAQYEAEFGVTIDRKRSVPELVKNGTPYAAITPEMAAIATSEVYTEPVLVANWELPAGAYGESDGPT